MLGEKRLAKKMVGGVDMIKLVLYKIFIDEFSEKYQYSKHFQNGRKCVICAVKTVHIGYPSNIPPRNKGLKIHCPQGRAGSSPAPGTNLLQFYCGKRLFFLILINK